MSRFTTKVTEINLRFPYDPFNRREALTWLKDHCTAHQSCFPIRKLADLWNWHRSKVERFLKALKDYGIIKTVIKHGKTFLQIILLSSQMFYKN